MNKTKNETGTFNQKHKRLLLTYKMTPHSTTNRVPLELIFGQRLRTTMDIIKPNLARTIKKNPDNKICYSGNRKMRTIEISDKVFVRNFGIGSR